MVLIHSGSRGPAITHTAAGFPKCVVVDNNDFDWQGDRPLNYHLRHSILYEAHVKGLTVHPSSGVANPGTYRGIVDAIPRLRDLGITSLELLPVQEFDEYENPRSNPDTGEQLVTLKDFAKHGLIITVLSLLVLWGWALFGYWRWIGFSS